MQIAHAMHACRIAPSSGPSVLSPGGTVAPPSGATLPVLVGSGHGVMRPEEVAHLAHRLRNLVLGCLPGVDAHLGLRRQTHGLHGHGVRGAGTSSGRTRIGVWQARTKSRVTVNTKSARLVYMSVRKS